MVNLLFISPHPDDVELGCLGTINLHVKKKDKIFVFVATDGERGNKEPSRYNRIEESIKCLKEVGVPAGNIIPLHLPDTRLFEHREDIRSKVENFCIEKKIDTLFVTSNKDYHQDHIVIFEEAVRGARKVKNIFMYESNSSTLSNFSPNLFVDISDFVDKKARYLQLHESQTNKHFITDSSLRSLAKFRGNQTKRVEYAEAFEIFRMVIEN